MKIENILFWIIVVSFLGYSCSKDIPPAFLAGKYNAYIYEVLNCNDPELNVKVDLRNSDSIYLFNCDTTITIVDSIFTSDSIFKDSIGMTTMGLDSLIIYFDTLTLDTMLVHDTLIENCNMVKYNQVTFEVDSVGHYVLVVDRTFNNLPDKVTTSGRYISSGFNDINFCFTDCLDSLWYHGLYVVSKGDLNLSWGDTITSVGCGYLIQADRIN